MLDKPFVFFGHSLGGLLAFELASHLRERSLPQPAHLIISGKQSLSATPRRDPIYQLPDDAFLNELEKYAGTPKEILESQELIQLMLPMLRADVTLFDRYTRRDKAAKLSCPISVFGSDNDPYVAIDDLVGWKAETTGDFDQHTFSGGHFFINDSKDEVIDSIRQIINNLPDRY
jgi:medium-chain acyl-[acyl-carrier-protein] hydrolase